MSKTKTAIVIGSGIAGLTAACLLAKQNYNVKIFEAASTYGGKIGEINQQGFRFDKGPSLFTLPEELDAVFTSCGKNPRDYYTYKKLPIVTRYFYNDLSTVDAFADLEQFKHELVEKLNENPKKLDKYFKHIADIYNFVSPIFLKNPVKKFYKHLPYPILKSVKQSLKIDAFKKLNTANEDWFSNPKTIQLFNRFATYNGSNPYKAPATLSVIPHLEHNLGAYMVDGGMRKVAYALYQLAKDLSCEFYFNTKVEQVIVENKIAKGVRVAGSDYVANKIVSNMDVNHFYPKLLGKKRKSIFLNQEKSTSALVFYWGVKTKSNRLKVHNILFSEQYRKEFEHLSAGNVFEDPTVYIYVSSKMNEQDAPEGHENWFTMINVPYDNGQNWDSIKKKARQDILDKIKKMLGKDIAEDIVFEECLTPKDIEIQTSSFGGALYGNSSNSMFSAFLRHPHKNKANKNLSFVGGSVHPGGGIPLCVLSAKIAVDGMD